MTKRLVRRVRGHPLSKRVVWLLAQLSFWFASNMSKVCLISNRLSMLCLNILNPMGNASDSEKNRSRMAEFRSNSVRLRHSLLVKTLSTVSFLSNF
jgi:hypothetical protein